MQIIERFAEIAGPYDAALCDVWGVVHNGRTAFARASEALVRFRALGKPVILLTNAPRPGYIIPPQLDRLGVPRAAWDEVVTSGDVSHAGIAARAPGPMFKLGPEKDLDLYAGLKVDFVTEMKAARTIVCTGPFDEARETPGDYRARFVEAIAAGAEMICVNPDKIVRFGDRLIYCAGALAELYAELGGRVVTAGKPHAPIYDAAMARLAAIAGRQIDRARVLAIGDGHETDILGANRAGFDSLFIASGIHAERLADFSTATLEAILAEAGARAQFAARELAW